ncbi:MAG TPA: DUF2087 domain-containing protein [Pilimelia sp.]|nr:DUF2087 domain-containing protein [Pilimelia sp.]
MTPEALCGLLAERARLVAFAAVVLGARTPADVAERSGLGPREVTAALRRLEQGGLVGTAEGGLVAHASAFKDAIRRYAEPRDEPNEPLDADRTRAAVLRAFLRDGRIVRLPAARAKRRILLEHVAAAFEPGVRYPEREVDAIVRAWYDDHATIRRYLVDEGLLTRERGVYWRVGGYVEV